MVGETCNTWSVHTLIIVQVWLSLRVVKMFFFFGVQSFLAHERVACSILDIDGISVGNRCLESSGQAALWSFDASGHLRTC